MSNATAYEMLRLLERKGFVRTTYGPTPRGSGAGRAPVLFAPTDAARQRFAELAAGADAAEEWVVTKARILRALEEGRARDPELLREVLARLPQTRSPLALAAEFLTASLLALHGARARPRSAGPVGPLLEGRATGVGLSMLAGVLLGLAWTARANRALLAWLGDQVGRYEAALQELPASQLEELSAFAGEVSGALARPRSRLAGEAE